MSREGRRSPDHATTDVNLQVQVLGEVAANVNGGRVHLTGRKSRALLSFLAMHAGEHLSVDRLIDGLWGDESPDSAQNALQVYVAGLRRDLGPAGHVIQTEGQSYRLDLAPSAVDALAFESAVEGARSSGGSSRTWGEALALWTGEPFSDLPAAPFMGPHTARLREARAIAIEGRIDAELAEGRHHELIPELHALVAEDPYRERTWRQLMLAFYRDGRQAEALESYQRARTILADELGLDPSPALTALEGAILNQDPALEPISSAVKLGIRLPAPPSDLVGRASERADLLDTVVRERLTTLLGPGGVGKTRLAIEVGAAAVASFGDGVVFVDLTAITSGDQVAGEVARACGVTSETPLTALGATLGDRKVLLILDNLEQVREAGPAVRSLLNGIPGVHLLVTSRVVMRIRGEQVVPLRPLDLADGIELFTRLLRAGRAVEPDASVMRRAVAQLDGLPLAIELAAASARTMSTTDLIARLEAGIHLPGGPTDLPDRHRTIDAALRWSSDLLGSDARAAWPVAAAFAAPFTLDAASAVAGHDLASAFAELVDSSLLTVADGRYRMLETVRQHAAALADRDALGAIADSHAGWVLQTAERSESALHSPRELEARAELSRILPDLRAACDRLGATDHHDEVARLLVATSNMWYHEGLAAELRKRLDRIVDSDRLAPGSGAKARVLRAVLRKLAGEAGSLETLRRELEPLRREAPDSVIFVNGLCHLADLEAEAGRSEEAFRLADEAVEAAHRTGDDGSVVMALDLASYVAQALGDATRAVEASRAALRVAMRGPTPQRVNALAGLAVALHRAGSATEAVDAAWQALAEADLAGSSVQVAEVTLTVADVLSTKDPVVFPRRLAEAFATFLAVGATRNATRIGTRLVEAGSVEAPPEATRLLGGLEARTSASDDLDLGVAIAKLRRQLGPERFARERAAGRAMGDDELARLAAGLVRAAAEAT